jgi:hypothetical protein
MAWSVCEFHVNWYGESRTLSLDVNEMLPLFCTCFHPTWISFVTVNSSNNLLNDCELCENLPSEPYFT